MHLLVVVVVVVVVAAAVLTSTRVIKYVVAGQAPVTLEQRNTPGQKTLTQKWHTTTVELRLRLALRGRITMPYFCNVLRLPLSRR